MRRAFAHTDADAGTGKVDTPGHKLALLDETVDGGTVDHDEVGGLATEKTPRHAAGRTVSNHDCIAGIVSEVRLQQVDDILYRRRDQSVQFCRVCAASAREHCGCEHGDAQDQRPHNGSSPLLLKIATAPGAISALIIAFAPSTSLALVVMPVE